MVRSGSGMNAATPEGGLSRRAFVRRAVELGIAIPTLGTLLAACGGGSSSPADGGGAGTSTSSVSETQSPSTSGQATTAAPSTQTPSDSSTKDTLIVGWGSDFLSLDPVTMRSTLDTELGYKLYSSLARIKSGTADDLVGDLAESWEISPDGLEHTYQLQPNATWHRGYGPVTAADVQYSFMRHKDESVGSLFTAEAAPIRDVTVSGDHTVVIHMADPYPGFIPEFAAYRPGFIVNQKAIEEAGDRYNERPIGSGPFMLENWSPKQSVEIVRYDEFYGNAGPFKSVKYVIIPEEATQEIALEKGEIDIAYFLEPESQARITSNPELGSASITGPRTYFLQINLEKPPLDDIRVRQALWWAIDKDALVDGITNGQGEATDTLLNPWVFGRLDERPYSYDPDRARQLLAEAGHADGFKTTMLVYDSTPLIMDLGAAIQDMWRKIGVEAELVQLEWAQHIETRRSGNFGVGVQPQLRLGPDQYVSQLMHSTNLPYPNASRYSNPEADELIDKARFTTDPDERRELYHEIQRICHRDVPVIPLINPFFVVGFRPEIQGVIPGIITLNLTEMSVAG